jgi:probable HAF family extracellular repeat protein
MARIGIRWAVGKAAKRAAVGRPRRRAPALEALEDRSLPSYYNLLDLGPVLSITSQANALNAWGDVAGMGTNAQRNRDAMLYHTGVARDIGTLGGIYGNARGINDLGVVVGEANKAGNTATHAFRYANGVMTDLGTLGGTKSRASAINDAGVIVGRATLSQDLYTHAFVYANGVMRDLGTLGGVNSEANAVNNAGLIVGGSFNAHWGFHAFRFAGGVMTDLGTLGGSYSDAFGVNDSGLIVGQSKLPRDTANHAFVYANGVMRDLGTLGGPSSRADDVNANGAIVGFADTQYYGPHAFLYSAGRMIDLNSLLNPVDAAGWTLEEATSINQFGQIVGYGINANGFQHAFLLTPPLQVTLASPTGIGIGQVNQISLKFSAPVAAGSFTPANILGLTGPHGAIKPTAVTQVAPTQFTISFPMEATPGSYTLRVSPNIRDTAGLWMDQNGDGLGGTLRDGYATSFTLQPSPLHFQFGPSTRPAATGYRLVTAGTSYNHYSSGFGWSAGTVYTVDRRTGSATTRYLAYMTQGTFSLDLANATYQVTVTMGDAARAHDRMGVSLQGVQVDSVNSPAGQSVSRMYRVIVRNGRLDLMLKDLGGADPFAVISQLDISRAG